MTQLLLLALDATTGRHARRDQALADAWAAEGLAGRTVWCTDTLAARLLAPGPQVGHGALEDQTDVTQVGPRMCSQDVVVLHDTAAAPLALAAREHGVHVVWHVDGPLLGARRETLDGFLHATDASADSYVMSWTATAGHGRRVRRIVSVLPRADVVAAVELPAHVSGARRRQAWNCVLAEAVHADRTEHVGGRVHARPAVAAR